MQGHLGRSRLRLDAAALAHDVVGQPRAGADDQQRLLAARALDFGLGLAHDAQVVLPLHRVGEGGAHQQVDHVADEQKRAVLDVPVAVEKPSVQDGRQDDQGDAPDEDSKRPDLACVLGAAQAGPFPSWRPTLRAR